MYEVNQIYNELKETHFKLAKLNCVKRQDGDYYAQLTELEKKQKELNERLKQKGWFFNYEIIALERLKE